MNIGVKRNGNKFSSAVFKSGKVIIEVVTVGKIHIVIILGAAKIAVADIADGAVVEIFAWIDGHIVLFCGHEEQTFAVRDINAVEVGFNDAGFSQCQCRHRSHLLVSKVVFYSGINLIILGNISVIVIEEIACNGVDGSILGSCFQLFLNRFIFQTEFIRIEADEMFLDILGSELFLNGVIDIRPILESSRIASIAALAPESQPPQ